ncbi:hypothetical protein ACUB8U_002864, partial [Salmonella enterica subsp. enterica serovar Kiambu]
AGKRALQAHLKNLRLCRRIFIFFAPRLFGQINNAFHHSCFDSFFAHDMFCRSGLPYAKGTSTRLIRLISIGGLVLFHGIVLSILLQ